jgi:sigma-E factor negative regulatory protein RseB
MVKRVCHIWRSARRPSWTVRAGAFFCAILLASFGVVAEASAADSAVEPQRRLPESQLLLKEMTQAHHDRSFSGRLVYMRGKDVSTLEFIRARIDGRDYERLTHLDGQAAELIRRGEQVVCVHADKTITRLAGRSGLAPLGLQTQLSSVIPSQYRASVIGAARVAGRKSWQLELVPVDQYRFGYRVWVDDESRLLLRSELVGAHGEALERLEFITLNLSPSLALEQFAVPAAAAEKNIESVSADDHPQGRIQVKAGWLPDGFMVTEQDIRIAQGALAPVSSRVFSDGLSAFTIFLERPPAGAEAGVVSHVGPTLAISQTYTVDDGEWLVTLVGEVPEVTARHVLDKLSFELQR